VRHFYFPIFLVGIFFSCSEKQISPQPGTLVDLRDGQSYKTIRVGNREWMAEDMNYMLRNSWCSARILAENSPKDSDNLSGWPCPKGSAVCEKMHLHCEEFGSRGRLYGLKAVEHVCPEGWRLPDSADWDGLGLWVQKNYPSEAESLRVEGSEGHWWNLGRYLLKENQHFFPEGKAAPHWFGAENQGFYLRGEDCRCKQSPCPCGQSMLYSGGNPSFWRAELFHEKSSPLRYVTELGTRGHAVKKLTNSRSGVPVRCVRTLRDSGSLDQNVSDTVSPTNVSSFDNTSSVSFGTLRGEEIFQDNRDGQFYPVAKIGDQKWLARNLNFHPAPDTLTNNSSTNDSLPHNSGCYYKQEALPLLGMMTYVPKDPWYRDSLKVCTHFGRIYTRAEAAQVCPEGWRLPRSQDWLRLAKTVDSLYGDSLTKDSLENSPTERVLSRFSIINKEYKPRIRDSAHFQVVPFLKANERWVVLRNDTPPKDSGLFNQSGFSALPLPRSGANYGDIAPFWWSADSLEEPIFWGFSKNERSPLEFFGPLSDWAVWRKKGNPPRAHIRCVTP
jgi:uncharacterized protein (TIGR02145 family)